MIKIKETALTKPISQSTQMDLLSAEKIVDEIYLEQPNLLSSVLVQNQLGNKIEHVDVLLRILIVCHLVLKYSGVKIDTITEELQQRELAKYTQHVSSTKVLNAEMGRRRWI